ncbi:MAG: hypothetical protein IKJ92_00010 [Bacteroidaceae bacterium]|nr:hypothetical protein [Bacteroidaceae bacterium]
MKKSFLLGWCLVAAMAVQAQVWTAPAVPGEDLSTLKQTDIVYVYNVEADAFLMYGMTSNTQACAARLTNGDYTASIPNQSYVFSTTDGRLRMRNKEKGASYYIACPSDKAGDVVINKSTNAYFTYAEVEEGSRVYTLTNEAYEKMLDVSWTYGGHLTLTDGSGQTAWAFIKESNVTNGKYGLYKSRKQLYDVYDALQASGKADVHAAALAEALEAYTAADATEESLTAAARKLFSSVCVDITESLEVSFMLDNADMVGSASAKPWHNGSPAFGWEEFEVYHATFTLEQEATLPLGTYDLGFHSLYREDGSGSAPTLTVTTNKGKYTGKTPLMGSIDYGVTDANDNNWVSRNGKIEPNGMQSCGQALAHGDAMAWARDIVVDAAGNMAIKYAVTSSAQWVNWQGFRLFYKGLSRDELAASLKAVIDEATVLYADGTGIGAADLQVAIAAATDVYGNAEATNKDVKDASDALLLAMKNYRYANASVENPIDKTDLIVNPSFEKQKEGWTITDMATQGNDVFKRKAGTNYLEKWTGRGGKVGNASALQIVQGLDMGIYQLVAGAQNIQEDTPNASQSGAWLVANDTKLAVDKTNDYTLTFVNIESNATIGFVAEGATGNWLSVDNFRLYYVGGSDADYTAELQRYIDAATALVDMKMHAAALDALKACIVAAQDEMAKGSTAGYIKVSTPLREAAETAQVSIDAYAALQAAITKAEEQYGEGQGLGAEDFMAAINAAKAAYADGATTYEELAHQIELLDQAAFNYMLGEPTGPVPTITKTDQRYARGSVMAFGRFTYNLNGAKLREAGFCYATEKAPTVDDQRSTRYFDNNGRIYIMDNMQPSTVYYARPYVVTEGYQVAYGDEIKIITLPKGGMTWSWNNGGSAEENERISGAIRYGMEVWNMFISLHGFHLTGNYGSGTPTADCSYGGWMRVGPNASYQRTGTIMHEAAHGVGVGTHWTWGTIMQGGAWTGSRANQVLQFWNNNTTETMRGDGTHMWPYGINGAHEDDGTDFLYYGNALIIQGLHEDGLQPTDATFASPAYTFGHDDEVKYYIKNESASYGLNTSYLTVEGTALKWSEATSADVAADDNFAWYLSFDPKVQHYSFRNAATGQYISLSGSTFKTVASETPTSAEKFHLMTGRRDVKVGSGTSAINVRGYWVLRANGNWANAMTAAAGGGVSLASFDIAADAAAQHWVILTAEETRVFDDAARGSIVNELKELIKNLRTMAKTPHTEDVTGADAALEAALAAAEAVAADADATLETLQAACKSLRQDGMDFLGSVTPASVEKPFDLTFLIADAAITTGEGWAGAGTIANSAMEFYEKTFDFNQTINGLPAGTYDLRAKGFNRPGTYTDSYADYQKGKNSVVAYLYAGTANTKLCHLAEGASKSQLHSDDKSVSSPAGYVPNTMASSAAYFTKGYYENSLLFDQTKAADLKIGIRQTSSASYYWTIFDNFRLYYYGSMSIDDVTSVEQVVTEGMAPTAVYNIFGQKVADSLEGLPSGFYICNGKKILVK